MLTALNYLIIYSPICKSENRTLWYSLEVILNSIFSGENGALNKHRKLVVLWAFYWKVKTNNICKLNFLFNKLSFACFLLCLSIMSRRCAVWTKMHVDYLMCIFCLKSCKKFTDQPLTLACKQMASSAKTSLALAIHNFVQTYDLLNTTQFIIFSDWKWMEIRIIFIDVCVTNIICRGLILYFFLIDCSYCLLSGSECIVSPSGEKRTFWYGYKWCPHAWHGWI